MWQLARGGVSAECPHQRIEGFDLMLVILSTRGTFLNRSYGRVREQGDVAAVGVCQVQTRLVEPY
jgi:hypothetical protein